MNKRLQKLFNKIEDQKQEVLEMIADLSSDQINAQPSTGKWSISQIISHLIIAERLSINYIQKKIQGIDKIENSGFLEEIKMLVLKVSQRIDGIKFNAPKYVVDNTIVYLNADELKNEWAKTRMDFYQLLERVEDTQLNKKIYKHAVAGYLNIQHAIQFFGEHVTHHTPQIKKLVKTSK
jgi:uncharacterized damage-inducible protein DinB